MAAIKLPSILLGLSLLSVSLGLFSNDKVKEETRVLFKKGLAYQMQGRYRFAKNNHFFIINSETGNEQFLLTKNIPDSFFREGKFSICFTVKMDCYLECEITNITKVKLIGPIEALEVYTPQYKNEITFKPDLDGKCKTF